MRWLALVIVLLAALCVTRVGVWAAYDAEGTLRLDARIGPLRVHILPAKKKKAKEPKKPKKAKAPKETAEPKKKGKLSFTLEDGKDALRSLLPPLKRALSRTRRGIKIKPLQVSLTLGGQEDPAAAAKNYGRLQTALWMGMPALEKLVDIPAPSIHTGVDFNASSIAVEGEVGVTFRIGTLLAIGFGLAVPALRWFLRFRKRKSQPERDDKISTDEGSEPAA